MVPLHKRKLVVQKAQEGKFFDFPETQGKPFQAPKSPLQFQKSKYFPFIETSFGGTGEAVKSLIKGSYRGIFSPAGIAALAIQPYQQLKNYAKEKGAELGMEPWTDVLSKVQKEKEAAKFIESTTSPAIPGSELDIARKAEEERSRINAGDYAQNTQNVQTVQPPPTVTGQPIGSDQNSLNVQKGIDSQKQSLENADIAVKNLEQQAAKQGRLAQLKEVKDLVKDIMGDEGYQKAGNLMLLQLAASLVSGRTDKPGFGGFLDVLGQSGQKIIPMAIALEREREKDELDLTKALISSMSKKDLDKINPPKERALITDTNGREKVVFVSTTDSGKFLAYDQINGSPIRYLIEPSQVKKFFKLEEDEKLNSKLLAEYQSLQSGEIVTRNLIDLVKKNPTAVANLGSAKFIASNLYGQLKVAFGGGTYNETFQNVVNDLSNSALNAVDPTKQPLSADDAKDMSNRVSSDIKMVTVLGQQLQSNDEEIKAQAAIKLYETIATYSLAQTLKKQDRLAVSDIENAKNQLGNVIGFGIPGRDPTAIIAAYSFVNADFRKKMKELEITARYQGQTSIDNLLKQQQDTYNRAGITTPMQDLISKTTSTNQQDFSKIFSKESLSGALLK